MLSSIIELNDGLVVIDDRPILRHLSMRLEPGEFLALMGANGSGKSTLVKAFLGLLPLTSGDLRLFGAPLDQFRGWSQIGFVPQRANALGGVPSAVFEVVAAGRLAHRRPFTRLSKHDREQIHVALTTVGLANRARDPIAALSGGQQQRVLIARALAAEPTLLVLDEPAAGVDYESQVALGRALTAAKARGVSVVLVAHELGPLAPLIDRTVRLRDGMVEYDGPPLTDHGHAEHHHSPAHPDHTPHVGSPLDPPIGELG